MVAVEQGQEAGLGAGGALDAAEAQVVAQALEVGQIDHQFLQPQAGALADGGQLGRLEVGEAQGRLIAPLFGEARQAVDHPGQLGLEDVEAVAQHDQVGVVAHVAAGGTQVDDRRSLGQQAPKVCTWAITSWRRLRSSSAARS